MILGVKMPNFNDIIGQDQIRDHFRTAIEQNKVSHAYILCGEKYSGKKYIANIFAAALLCESEGEVPCGKCHSCSQALSANNPDIIYVTHEKPNVIGVDDIRTQVNQDINIRPYAGRKKIYIIDEAEKMNQQAQNAILKTFEEPPEYGVILLLVTNANVLLPTILSRAVMLNMKPVSDTLIKKYLMEEVKIPDYRADMCVAFSRGNLGKARLLSENEDFDNLRKDVVFALKNVKNMDIADLSLCVKKAAEYKGDIEDYFDIIMVWYRDVCLYKSTGDSDGLIFTEELQYIKKVALSSSFENISRIFEAVEIAGRRLKANVNFELTIELLFLAMQEN